MTPPEGVKAMEASGRLDYVEVVPWFANENDYRSAQGHLWGVTGHAIIDAGMAQYIRRMLLRSRQ